MDFSWRFEAVKAVVSPRSSWLNLLPSLTGAIALSLWVSSVAQAQVASDATLGTIVNTSGGIADITGGTQAGTNLFHSFGQFSLSPSSVNTAVFNHDPAVQNIITRVTGGSISNINGRIQAGNVNLFFLNPSGIVFGEQASIEIGGSFIASTANSLKFSDGQAFSPSTPSGAALLLVNVPIGLQYGANPDSIQVQGSGNFVFVNPDPFQIIRDFRPPGLAVQPGKTLALIGGSVEIQGGNLTAADGQIAIGAVANSTVTLTPSSLGWNFTYPTDATFQDIVFSQAASADVSGNGSGQIQVQAQRISVLDGSSLLALTLGDGTGGQIRLDAKDAVTVQGGSPYFPSSLLTEVDLGATGNAGSLIVNAGQFLAASGAKISTSTSGAGNGGLLQINANTIEVNGGSLDFGPTLLSADSVGMATTGTGGQIVLNAGQLSVVDGGGISLGTNGIGKGGTLQINAQTVDLIGNSPDYGPSGIFAATFAGSVGQGGNVSIQSDRLRVTDGAVITLDTAGDGNSGDLQIIAKSLEISGTSGSGDPSLISTQVSVDSNGNGGIVTIQANDLTIRDQGRLQGGTSGNGNGGTVAIRANNLTIRDQGLVQLVTFGNGNGANLSLSTDLLSLSSGAKITTSTGGLGNAGSLQIAAQTISLQGEAALDLTGIFAAAERGSSGNGGLLQIDTQRLEVLGGAQIATTTFSTGKAGNLIVNAQQIELAGTQPLGSSGLFSGALVGTGAGGDLQVNSDRLLIRDGATISASNFPSRSTTTLPGQGPAGNITLQANNIVLDRGTVTASTATGGSGNVQVRSQVILLKNGSLIAANAQGAEPGGNISINTTFLIGSGNSDITANALNAQGGRVTVNAQGIYGLVARDRLTPNNDITATSELGVAFNGIVQLNTPDLDPTRGLNQLVTPLNNRPQVTASCERIQGNEFVVTGRGGLPEDASQPIRGGTTWSDLRLPNLSGTSAPVKQSARSQPQPIIEAQRMTIDALGNVLLVATPSANSSSIVSQAIPCPAR